MKTVYLVRHGETIGNVRNFSQLPDTELTEKGHAGASSLAKRFSNVSADKLLVSPYKRAQQTSLYVSEETGLTPITLDFLHEALRPEVVRGKVYKDQAKQIYQQYFVDFWQEKKELAGMENWLDITRRIMLTLEHLEEQKETDIIIVSHGDFIRFLIAFILVGTSHVESCKQVSDSLQRLDNVAMSVIEHTDSKWKLKRYNDAAHFADN